MNATIPITVTGSAPKAPPAHTSQVLQFGQTGQIRVSEQSNGTAIAIVGGEGSDAEVLSALSMEGILDGGRTASIETLPSGIRRVSISAVKPEPAADPIGAPMTVADLEASVIMAELEALEPPAGLY